MKKWIRIKAVCCITALLLLTTTFVTVNAAETVETNEVNADRPGEGENNDGSSSGGGHQGGEHQGGGHATNGYHPFDEDYNRIIRPVACFHDEDYVVQSTYKYFIGFKGDGNLIVYSYYYPYCLGLIMISDKPMDYKLYKDIYVSSDSFLRTDEYANGLVFKIGENGSYYVRDINLALHNNKISFSGVPNLHTFSSYEDFDNWRTQLLSIVDLSEDNYKSDDDSNGDNSGTGDDDGDGTGGTDDGDDDGKPPDFDLDWSNIFTLIYSILKALVDFVVFVLNMLVEFATLLLGQIGQFSSLIGAVFTFLPEEFITMILTGITVIVLLGIVRR